MEDKELVKSYYDNQAETEWKRLEGFHFEFEITKAMLQKYMKKGTVLDIGGGPGRYSVYLAQLGFDVTLVDLSHGNVELAKQNAAKAGVKINAYQCDACDMEKLNLGQFDNVLLMGPLYHLTDETDRKKCVLEAKRHLNDGGVLFASFIMTHGGFNYYLDAGPDLILRETQLDLFDCMAQDKSWSGDGWTKVFFAEQEKIAPFFDSLGLEKITLFGQEGVTATRLGDIEASSEEVRKFYLNLSLRLCEKPKYFAYSSHLMYVGKKKV